jgi:tetratricopeptide (TPR) repeat protein
MLDWSLVATNSIWIGTLAMLLAAASWRRWQAADRWPIRGRVRVVIRGTALLLVVVAVAAGPVSRAATRNAAAIATLSSVSWGEQTHGAVAPRFPTLCGEPAWVRGAGGVARARLERARAWGATGTDIDRRLAEFACGAGDHAGAEAIIAKCEAGDGCRDSQSRLLAGWNAMANGDRGLAVSRWRAVPNTVALLVNYAEHDLHRGDPTSAVVLAEYATAVDAACGRAWFLRARAAESAGSAAEALARYLALISAPTRSAAQGCRLAAGEAELAYAHALLAARRFEESERWATEAVRLRPGAEDPLLVLGDARWNGRLDAAGAEAAYRAAVEAAPHSPGGALGLASLFLTLNQPQRALPWIDRAERLVRPADRDRPQVLRGQALLEQGRLRDARTVLEDAARHNPGNGWSFYFLGRISATEGDPEAASRYYARAASLLPGEPGVKAALSASQPSPRDSQSR